MDAKKQLAYEIIKKYWSNNDAKNAQNVFEDRFQKKTYESAVEIILPLQSYTIIDLITHLDKSTSRSQARTLIDSGALTINGIKITDQKKIIQPQEDNNSIIKIGKHRIFKIFFN
jgi:tyrosyl-tRNA synthetase